MEVTGRLTGHLDELTRRSDRRSGQDAAVPELEQKVLGTSGSPGAVRSREAHHCLEPEGLARPNLNVRFAHEL